ncbi:hypothetical protein CKA32_007091 [Geitlerinema sp. FC II]|nr:hypothetical protein CKA32_007091 [Geitlerinema sp. FC II]
MHPPPGWANQQEAQIVKKRRLFALDMMANKLQNPHNDKQYKRK